MNMIATATHCELKKIFWRPKYCIMPIIYAVIALITGIGGASGLNSIVLSGLSIRSTGPDIVYGALSMYRMFLIPLAVFMLSADVFTHELESKSIKCVLVRPVSRFDAYLAKCLAILCYTAIALGAGLAVVILWHLAAPNLAAAVSQTSGVLFGAPQGFTPAAFATLAAEAFASYALTLLPLAAFVAFAAFVSVVIRSPALVMFLCIVSYLAAAFFGTFYTGAGAALFTTYTGWYRMWLGERLPLTSIINTAALLLSTCAAFFGFGYFIFDKKDI